MPALNRLYDIGNYIDTNALGFSARVSRATHWKSGQDVAFKVMRCEHHEDDGVWEQFATEIDLLWALKRTLTNQMIDCGFVSDTSHERPSEGEVISLDRQPQLFREQMAEFKAKGWRPYITLERLPWENCLLNLILGTDGVSQLPLRLPTVEGVALALQFTEFLRQAHQLDIVYLDHKPEHAFWDGKTLRVIDLNVSRFLGEEMSQAAKAEAKYQDLRNFIVGVLYTTFTGRDFRFTTQPLQARPSSPDGVKRRFEGISQLDFGMDDTLLPALCDLLNQYVISGGPEKTADTFLEELSTVAVMVGWDVNGHSATDEARAARRAVQQGLAELRRAQAHIDKAKEHFLQASTLDTTDRDSERLYREASKFHKHRILP